MRAKQKMKIPHFLSFIFYYLIFCGTGCASVSGALEAFEGKIWGDFISEHGLVLDYKGDLPAPQDCIEGRPNFLNWWGPTENAAKFTGLYLASVCQRHNLNPSKSDAEKARTLARGLMLCASVSDVDGFVSRGVSLDGKTHYPLGSEDQTIPWIYGLYLYIKSGIPGDAEKKAVISKIIEVCSALDKNGWNCPCDGKFKGQHRGELAQFRFFQAPCMLFGLRVMWDLTQSSVWRGKYYAALREKDAKIGKTRMEICSRGYRLDDGWLNNIDKNFLWIYVKGQAALRMLFDMETAPDAKEAFLAGLRANASNAFKVVGDYKLYDNSANYPFTSSDWRRIYKWRPQKSQKDAEELAMMQLNSHLHGSARKMERNYMTNPMSAAAMLAFSGDPKYRETVEKVISHYDYSKFHLGEIIYASVAYSAMETYIKE